jgi:hypothetical protein
MEIDVTPPNRSPASPPERMADYRKRMRAAGLRPVQIWVPDTRTAAFADICRAQALAVAKHDPAGDELMRFVADIHEWPEA